MKNFNYQGKRKDQLESSNKIFFIAFVSGSALIVIVTFIELWKLIFG